jgi:hypothetical protein
MPLALVVSLSTNWNSYIYLLCYWYFYTDSRADINNHYHVIILLNSIMIYFMTFGIKIYCKITKILTTHFHPYQQSIWF